MRCLTVQTKCRLCGGPFEEGICVEDRGRAWRPPEGHPLEDGAAWCGACLKQINETCEALCADIEVSIGDEIPSEARGEPTEMLLGSDIPLFVHQLVFGAPLLMAAAIMGAFGIETRRRSLEGITQAIQ